MKRIRMGIVGCGVIGSRHAAAAAAAEHIELTAVADVATERAAEIAGRFGVPNVYADGQALLSGKQVDAVVLALPTALRTPLAFAAFEQGLHVLLEKPVAMHTAELDRLIAARGSLVAACASSRFRFLPSAVAVTDFLKTDPLGELRSIFFRAFSPAQPLPEKPKPAWRLRLDLNGAGILGNWGCYDLDYLLGITGWRLRPLQVLAQTWPIAPELRAHVPQGADAETHAIGWVRCAEGVILHFERAEYVPLVTSQVWEIIGTKGALRLHMTPSRNKQLFHDALDDAQGTRTTTLWTGDDDGTIVHARPVLDFADAIIEGRAPATTLEQARVIQQITDAVYASSASGRIVDLK